MGSTGGGDAPAPTEIQETEQEKALATVAKGSWDRYKTVLAPFEDKFMANMRTTEGQLKSVMGQTSAGVGKQFDNASAEVNNNMFRGGINPGSGRYKGTTTGMTAARGATSGSAAIRAGLAADDMTTQNLQNAIKMGRGEATTATRGMSDLARDAAGEASNTASLQTRYNLGISAADTAANNAMKSSVATAAGMGLSGWKSGQTAGGSFSPDATYDPNNLRYDM